MPFPELDSPCTEETVPVSLTGGSKGVKLFIIAEHIKFTWLQFLAHKVDPKVSKGSQKTRGREKEYLKNVVSETGPWLGKLDALEER